MPSGKFLKADLAGVTAAAAGAAKDMPADFRVSITDAPGAAAYPDFQLHLAAHPGQFHDATKRDAVKGFLEWMLTDGQSYNESLSYAKLPSRGCRKGTEADRDDSVAGGERPGIRMSTATTAIDSAAPPESGPRALLHRLRHGDEVAHLLTLIFAATILLITSMHGLRALG